MNNQLFIGKRKENRYEKVIFSIYAFVAPHGNSEETR
jgi:hypothetical protein